MLCFPFKSGATPKYNLTWIAITAFSFATSPAASNPATDAAALHGTAKQQHHANRRTEPTPDKRRDHSAEALQPWAAVDPKRVIPPKSEVAPTPRETTRPRDVDLGLKWNGNNETATQTRTQNYSGEAQGSGAEIGMKFHF